MNRGDKNKHGWCDYTPPFLSFLVFLLKTHLIIYIPPSILKSGGEKVSVKGMYKRSEFGYTEVKGNAILRFL